MRKSVLAVLAFTLLVAGCSRLGTGLPGCRAPVGEPSAATVLSVQAVPQAAFSPCLNSLQLGWDGVDFEVEKGLVRLEFERNLDSFLEVRLTPSCEIGDATEVASGIDGIARYEDVTVISEEVRVTLIPESERPRIYAQSLAEDLDGARLDDRPVIFNVDVDIDESVRSRVNRALFSDDFVWIISDLDIDEGTLELRANPDNAIRVEDVDDAFDIMEDVIEDVQYRGNWFFLFEGGCITYDFDAEGSVAASVADDAESAIGFFDNKPLLEAGRSAGFEFIEQ